MSGALGVKGLLLRGEKVLVLRKANGGPDLPGGRLQEGETPEECLQREIVEELGPVRVEVLAPVAAWSFLKDSGLFVNGTTWLCRHVTGEVSLSSEHSGFTWESITQLKNLDICQKYGLDKFSLQKALSG